MNAARLQSMCLLGACLACTLAHANETKVKRTHPMQAATNCCAVLELRQYTLKPGQRDVLIGLFDDKFVAGQEAAGMTIVGQFRDLDAPDRFVWLRGFAGMPQRKLALETFYGGPIWQANRTQANATMIDSDNVLLLRPATKSSGFERKGLARDRRPAGLVAAYLHYLQGPADASVLQDLEHQLRSTLQASGAQLQAVLVSEHSENTFPALPVRLGEEVLVWVAGFADQKAYDAQRDALEDIVQTLQLPQTGPSERLRLSATTGSLLRGAETQP
ncbi:MAG: NIPSNAP family protein [Pseudoxanthomonas sp.]